MARLNVYVPDELSERARAADLNISALTQAAITAALDQAAVRDWLSDIPTGAQTVDHTAALQALDDARDELDGDA